MTSALIAPGSEQFQQLFRSFTTSAFRLETQQSYAASGEDAAFDAFCAGQPYVRHPGKEVWLEHIERAASVGATMSRVHVLTEPLSEYVRFETTWAYTPNVDIGEDIRIICLDQSALWPNELPRHDFWLFDNNRLYDMHYAVTGTFLGVEPVEDSAAVQRARVWRDQAWNLATPWSEWIATRPDLMPYLPR